MSHFSVVVRVPGWVAEADVSAAVASLLAPYHEFECTGVNDQYVQSIDRTEEVRTGAKARDENESLTEWVEGYYGWKPVADGSAPELEGVHKYGWFRVNAAGELAEAFDRTNPNKKWGWWEIGGRWSGYFPVKVAPTAKSEHETTLEIGIAAAEAGLRNATTPETRWPFIEIEKQLRAELYEAVASSQEGVRLGRAGTFGNIPERGNSDVVRKSEIDFDKIAASTRESAEKFHAEWERFIAGEKFDAFEGPRDTAIRIGLLTLRRGAPEPGEEDRVISWTGKVPDDDSRSAWNDIYQRISLDELIQNYADAFSPISGYACLDENGWHEPGEMGWFGCSSDTPESLLASKREFTRWLKETPSDAWLVAVDCHI